MDLEIIILSEVSQTEKSKHHMIYIYVCVCVCIFPGGSDGKESACSVGDLGSIPGLGRSPGGGHGNPLQYPCLENPWRIPGTEEPEGLQCMRSQRIGHA